MTIEQITSLVNAGFTKDEIMAMTAPENPAPTPEAPKDPAPEAPKDPAPEAPKDPAPAPAAPAAPENPAPAPDPAPAVDLAQVLESNKLIMENVAKLTAALQANAIATAVQPGIPAQYTGDQAIAEIIAPPRKENK